MTQTTKTSAVIIVVVLIIAGFVIWASKNEEDSGMTNIDSKMPASQGASNDTPNMSNPATAKSEANSSDMAYKDFENTIPTANWTLWRVTVNNKTADLNINVPAPLTLQFDTKTKKVSGFSGCNTFSGPYTVGAKNKLVFGPLMYTEIGCPDTLALEKTILVALDKITMYGMKGDQLVLDNDDGSTEIVYNQAK